MGNLHGNSAVSEGDIFLLRREPLPYIRLYIRVDDLYEISGPKHLGELLHTASAAPRVLGLK